MFMFFRVLQSAKSHNQLRLYFKDEVASLVIQEKLIFDNVNWVYNGLKF